MKKDDKTGRLDIKATINNNKIVNIEIQLQNEHNMEKRSEYYAARLIAEQFHKTEKYEKLKPVILINILNYNLLSVPDYCTKTVTVAENHREYEVMKDVTYYFIELPKFRKKTPRLANLLEGWLTLIDGEDDTLMKSVEEQYKILKQARKELKGILSDEQIEQVAESRFTASLERASAIEYAKNIAKEQGMKEGKEQGIKEGKEQGIKEGIKEGLKEGIKEGEKKKAIKIAKEMLKAKMSIEQISTLTELSKEEIEKLISKKTEDDEDV